MERETPLVWQNFALFPHMSVQENVEYGLRMRGVARAIVLPPRVLLLDEPLGALDMTTAHALQRELKRLHRDLGITFICVTHNQNEAFSLANRVAIMSDGEVQQIGSPRDISDSPRNKFVAKFIGLPNFVTGAIVSVKGGLASIETPLGRLSARAPADTGSGVHGMIVVFPDRIKITRSNGKRELPIAGRVVSIDALGLLIAVVVGLKDDLELVVHLTALELDCLRLTIGMACSLSWPAEAESSKENSVTQCQDVV